MRLKSFDNLLMLVMGAFAFMSLYMLYGQGFVLFNTQSEIKVASIVEQLKTVKRKKDFYQGWMDVKSGDSLSENDEIYTHGQSSAKIRFLNGPEISLFENSLLRIKKQSHGSTFSLDKGNLIAKLDKNSPQLDIELNGKKYSFSSDNANIQIEQSSAENKFLLLNGKAKLADQEILPNQVVIQDIKTGVLKIKQIPVIPQLPEHNFTEYFLKSAPLEFKWSYTNAPQPVTIAIAKDSSFKSLLLEKIIEENHFETTLTEAGTYYWRLSSNNVDGPIRTFTLIEETPLVLNSDKSFLYQGPKSKDKIFLNWSKNKATHFLLKIQSPDNKTNEIKLATNTFEFLPELIGEYTFSVKVDEEKRPLALWSHPTTIHLLESKPISITALSPDQVEKVNYSKEPLVQLISWDGPGSGVVYKVNLTRNNKTIKMETEQTSIPLSLKEAGEYVWEVQGETPSGVVSNKLTGKIIIKVPLRLSQLPSEGAVIELEKPDQLVAFKWDKVEDSRYQFELSDDTSFKKILLTKEVDNNNISTSLAETGKYYWRVKIKKGNTIEYSNPVSVEIKPTPPLARPEVSPEIKIKLKYEEEQSSFHFIDLFIARAMAADPVAFAEWDLPANTKAKSYVVEIYQDSSLKNLITKIESENPHVVWKNASPGNFYWRVAYIDFWGRQTEFSKASILSTELESIEIELTSPKHKENILEKIKDKETFKWAEVPRAKSYQFLLATDLDFEKILVDKATAKNEMIVSCDDLKNEAGDYYWKIKERHNTSKRRAIHATCARPEPAKVEVAKKEAPVMTPETPVEIPHNHFLQIAYRPYSLSAESKGSLYRAQVDGTVLNSWGFNYQRPVSVPYFTLMKTELNVSRGKVFNDITFTDLDLSIKLKHSFWGAMVSYLKKTSYNEVGGNSISDEALSSPLLGVFAEFDIQKMTLSAEAKGGSLFNIKAEALYHFPQQISAGVYFSTTSGSKNNNDHSYTELGLNLNYTFDFLDKK